MGHHHCRIVGMPVEAWEDAAEQTLYFTPDSRRPAHRVATLLVQLRSKIADGQAPADMIGISPGFTPAYDLIQHAARPDHRAPARRDRRRQGALRARAARAVAAPRPRVRRRELRRDPERVDRGRAVRRREGRLHRSAAAARAASSAPTAAPCSSTRSASCRCRRRASCCACCRRARSSAWATKDAQGQRADHRGDERRPRQA